MSRFSSAPIDSDRMEAAKALRPLSDLVLRQVRMRQRGRVWWGSCPFHDERHASFRVDDWRGNFKCFGCGARGDAITWLQHIHRLSFIEALTELEGGKLPSPADLSAARERNTRRREAEMAARRRRSQLAREIFAAAGTIQGTPGEAYLRRTRGILLPKLPATLRFGPAVSHPEGGCLPAIVAAWQAPGDKAEGGGRVTGIWRIFLDPRTLDTAAPKKAPIKTDKAGLGDTIGNGGAVRLGPAAPVLGTGEGIETCLSGMSACSDVAVWAGCATGGLENMVFPAIVDELWIWADRDPVNLAPGPSFGQRPGERSADIQRRRALDAGIAVKVIVPRGRSGDFNDMLMLR